MIEELLPSHKKIINMLGKGFFDVKEISEETQYSQKTVRARMAEMKEYGIAIHSSKSNGENTKYNIPKKPMEKTVQEVRHSGGKNYRIALLSDTHLGAITEDLKSLYSFYEIAHSKGVTEFYHSGDICDGTGVYPGQLSELKEFTGMKQVIHCVKNYPSIPGCKTFFITGNHDLKLMQREDIDIGPMIARQREDMVYLGQYEADVMFEKARLRLVHPDGGMPYALCFDDKTEILTDDGWKFFKDLNKEEKVATLDNEGNLIYQKPIDYITERYKGKMYHFKSKTFDLLTTPNHRFYVRNYPKLHYRRKKELKYPTKSHRRISFEWKFKSAEELKDCRRQEYQMTKKCNWKGKIISHYSIPFSAEKKYASYPMKHLGTVKIEPLLQLIAWFITEGSIQKTCIKISQYKKQNKVRIAKCITEIGLEPTIGNKRDVFCYSRELCEFLENECGRGYANKHIPKWIKELDSSLLKPFIETMVDGDGWRKDGKIIGYKSYSNKLIDDMQEILIKCNYSATVNNKHNSISITNNQMMPTIKEKPKVVDYDGHVYCVTVPNEKIMVRRSGRNIWSGNTYRLQKYIENISGGTKPNIISMGHLHQSVYAEIRNIHGFMSGSFQRQNNFLRRKGVDPQVSAWIIDFNLKNKFEINNLRMRKIRFY